MYHLCLFEQRHGTSRVIGYLPRSRCYEREREREMERVDTCIHSGYRGEYVSSSMIAYFLKTFSTSLNTSLVTASN